MTRATQRDREPLSGRKLRERALDLLSRRDHSELELLRKLEEKGGDRTEILDLIEDLRNLGYIDDRRFAENFIRYRAAKAWGVKRYRQELLQRGVDRDVIEAVLSASPQLNSQTLSEKVEEIVKREFEKGRSPQKVVASLLRKGFAVNRIRRALDDVAREAAAEPPGAF